MRVALVVPRFPNVSETFVMSRVIALLERGWDVQIVCGESDAGDWNWFPEAAPIDGLRQRVHARQWAPTRVRMLLSLPFELLRTLAAAPLATLRYLAGGLKAYGRGLGTRFIEDAVLIRLRPDIVHYEFGHLAVRREATTRLVGAKLVCSFQGYDMNYAGLAREPGFFAELWERIDAAHFISRDLLDRAEKRGFPPHGPAFLVSNGVDPSKFDGETRAHTEVTGTAERPVRLVSVGRLHWKKGYDYALQATRILRDRGVHVDYRIVGDGDHREAILFSIFDLDLRDDVTLLGSRSSDEVRNELARADILVHPAISEGFCLAVTEAQMMQVPVVVSDADGLSDNVSDGETGFVVPRRDARALADRVAELAADPALRDRMGRAGRERATKLFSVDAYADGVADIYRSLMRGAPGGAAPPVR